MTTRTDDAAKTLVLTSSNASKKYISNAFQSLSWPKGWVVHFRYELRWVEDELRNLLPLWQDTNAGNRHSVANLTVLTAYVFQRRNESRVPPWDRVALYPLRHGSIVDAYKTGNGDNDVAHFYFKVGSYWDTEATASIHVKDLLGLVQDGKNAGLTAHPARVGQHGESAAQALIDSIRVDHLTHQPDRTDLTKSRQYYPILCYLRGMRPRRGQRGGEIDVQVEPSETMSFFKLTERKDYWFDFSFHVPASLADAFGTPDSGSSITLTYDADAFSSDPARSLAVESRYDEQAWLITPATTDKKILREIQLSTQMEMSTKAAVDWIDLNFTIPVEIRQDGLMRLRFIVAGLIGDFGLALGTIALAVGKVAPSTTPATGPFGLPSDAFALAVVGYLTAAVFKVLAGVWRL
jgi:hypothetical protein